MESVLVTGGTGFIGRHLVNELIHRGVKVAILTSTPVSSQTTAPLAEIIYTTYDYDDLVWKLAGREYDTIYHLGWGGVSEKDKNNIPLQLKNIQVSIDMLRLSKEKKCDVFIAAGTVAEYVFNKDIIDVSLRQTPNDVYGATKVSVHYLLEVIARQIGQDMIWAVLPSTFGEGRKGNNIITYTITSLLKRERPVYGNLEQMWDFLYVTEVARALVMIGEKARHNTTYGIGSGTYKPLKEYVCAIRDMIDPNLPLGIGEKTGQQGLISSCINIEQLKRDTGWSPVISFEDGMKRTISYYKKCINQ